MKCVAVKANGTLSEALSEHLHNVSQTYLGLNYYLVSNLANQSFSTRLVLS